MLIPESLPHRKVAAGFALPAILVVVGALLILALGILLVVGIERKTARSFADRQRAALAASAGLEDVKGILNLEAANDDFLVIQSTLASPITAGFQAAPNLFLARGKVDAADITKYSYRYIPLFSTLSYPASNALVAAPAVEPLLTNGSASNSANQYKEFTTLPYNDKVRASWLPVEDDKGRTIARYAYWVEDLQAKLDPKLVGNLAGTSPANTHAREPYPFPAPGLNPKPDSTTELPLNQVALYAIDSSATQDQQKTLGKTLIDNRRLLLSPDSLLSAAAIQPPIVRDAAGHQSDPIARSVEENLATNLQPYFEKPLIPYSPGIKLRLIGTPKKNLNELLSKSPSSAVNEMAAFINLALPDFDSRKGGFPSSASSTPIPTATFTEDYVKTLAANAIDYADAESTPTILAGSYRGLDVAPLLSELCLQINYLGKEKAGGRNYIKFSMKVHAELFNPTDKLMAAGKARISYEVALHTDSIGSGTEGLPFDSPALLDDSAKSTHSLTKINGLYWTPEINVSLEANQYRAYAFGEVTYRIDIDASTYNLRNPTPFSLLEDKAASGMSLMWNGTVIDRAHAIIRQQGLVYSPSQKINGFEVNTPRTITKSSLPGLAYEKTSAQTYANPGDPRIGIYMRSAPLEESAFPENMSPNRRNIRLQLYNDDALFKPKVYARMLPSEWPDGGHNSEVGTWTNGANDKTEFSDPKFNLNYDPKMKNSAIQNISNKGVFYSATELGRIFDPIMYQPKFSSSSATASFLGSAKFPAPYMSWPDVVLNDAASNFYGGGNTLRIGRPEHPAFDTSARPGMNASNLLDLFHTGVSRSAIPAQQQGAVVLIQGHVNVNTASRDALRAMAAGSLVMDPLLSSQTSGNHDGSPTMAPPKTSLTLDAPTNAIVADRIADAVIRSRPYSSTGFLAHAKEADGTLVFGNKMLYPDPTKVEWNDEAAEEIFARVYESSTVRSRNYRVWVIAQAVAPTTRANSNPEVLAEVRKVSTIFADPGERAADGSIVPAKFKTKVTATNDY